MDDQYYFEKGNTNDFLAVINDAINWCNASDKETWKKEEINKPEFINSIEANSVIVLKNGTDTVAGMLLQWSDQIFWKNAKPDDSGYIHKLCVSRKYAGRNISSLMIEYAKEQCKINKVPLLRLDTSANKKPLRDLYERNGFKLVGYHELAKTYCLYEMKV